MILLTCQQHRVNFIVCLAQLLLIHQGWWPSLDFNGRMRNWLHSAEIFSQLSYNNIRLGLDCTTNYSVIENTYCPMI